MHLGSAPACLPSISFSHHILSSLPRNCLYWSLSSQCESVLSPLFSSFCSLISQSPTFLFLSLLYFASASTLLLSPTLPGLYIDCLDPFFSATVTSFVIFIKLSLLSLVNLLYKKPYPPFDFRYYCYHWLSSSHTWWLATFLFLSLLVCFPQNISFWFPFKLLAVLLNLATVCAVTGSMLESSII